jgi:hypothetical protein
VRASSPSRAAGVEALREIGYRQIVSSNSSMPTVPPLATPQRPAAGALVHLVGRHSDSVAVANQLIRHLGFLQHSDYLGRFSLFDIGIQGGIFRRLGPGDKSSYHGDQAEVAITATTLRPTESLSQSERPLAISWSATVARPINYTCVRMNS